MGLMVCGQTDCAERITMNKAQVAGISEPTILQIVFIVLKLCKVINWSWWWVMAPTWISIIIATAVIVIRLIWRKEVR